MISKLIQQALLKGENNPITAMWGAGCPRGAGNVYLLVLSSWKVNIAENPIAGVVDMFGLWLGACTVSKTLQILVGGQ